MRRVALALLVLALPSWALAASTNVADLPAGHFRLDPKHSSLSARVLHLGVSNYTLRFDRLDADFTYDPAHPEATKLQASVDTASLDVDGGYGPQFARDFLQAAQFPKATFTATAITPAADGRTGIMTGDLTLMGVTRPVTFNVTFVAVGHGLPFGTVAGFSATDASDTMQMGPGVKLEILYPQAIY